MARTMYQGDWQVSFKREDSVRNGDSAIADGEAQRWGILKSIKPPKFVRKFEPIRSGGALNPTHHVEQGYELSESTIEMPAQLYMLWRYVMTNCETVGTDTSETNKQVDSVVSQYTIDLDASTQLSQTGDNYAGYYVEVTSGTGLGYKFVIASDTPASTDQIKVTTDVSSLIDNTSIIKIVGPTYTHTITEGRTQPTFAMHTRFPHPTSSTEDLIRDYLGCQVKSAALMVEKGGTATFSFGITAMKEVAGTNITHPSDPTEDPLVWASILNISLQYNGSDIISNLANYCDRVEITIENEYEVVQPGGDENPKTEHWVQRTYTPKLHLFPTNNDLYDLLTTKLSSYTGDLSLTFKIGRSSSDYIQISFDKLRLTGLDEEWPEQGDYGVDLEFTIGTGASCSIEIKDSYGLNYYEGPD